MCLYVDTLTMHVKWVYGYVHLSNHEKNGTWNRIGVRVHCRFCPSWMQRFVKPLDIHCSS
jgi:hypothetical protein